MNTRTHGVLYTDPFSTSLDYTGLIRNAKINEMLGTAAEFSNPRSPKPTSTMDILIFGPQTIGDALARHLGKHHLFLQHPYQMATTVEYDNPQYLGTTRDAFTKTTDVPLSPAVDALQKEADPSERADYVQPADLSQVIDDLPTHDYLREANTSTSIKTRLHR